MTEQPPRDGAITDSELDAWVLPSAPADAPPSPPSEHTPAPEGGADALSMAFPAPIPATPDSGDLDDTLDRPTAEQPDHTPWAPPADKAEPAPWAAPPVAPPTPPAPSTPAPLDTEDTVVRPVQPRRGPRPYDTFAPAPAASDQWAPDTTPTAAQPRKPRPYDTFTPVQPAVPAATPAPEPQRARAPRPYENLVQPSPASSPEGASAASLLSPTAKKTQRPKKTKTPKPEKAPRTRDPKPAKPTRPARATSSTFPRRALLAGAAVAVIGSVGAGALWTLRDPEEKPATGNKAAPSAQAEVSRVVPPGWSRTPAWVQAADVASNVAVRAGHIAFLNSTGVLIVLDDATGKTVLSSTPTGAKPAESRVILTTVGATLAAVVAQDASITAWDVSAADAAGHASALPSGALVTSGGQGLMVLAGAQTLTLTPTLGMQEVQGLPAGNTSIGLAADGRVVSGSPQGGWVLSDGATTVPVTPALAAGAIGAVMYPVQASKGLVAAWAPTADPAVRAVALHAADTGAVVAQTTLPTDQVNLGLGLTVADGGQLAAVGPWLVNVADGGGGVTDGWTTVVSTSKGLYGDVGGSTRVWRGSGDPVDVPADAALPWGITDAGNAVIVTADKGRKALAAVTPE